MSRKIRLVILAVLGVVAVVGWQATEANSVRFVAQQLADSEAGPMADLVSVTERRSDVLADFYASDAFDPYREWYIRYDTTQGRQQRNYDRICDRAESSVFLPPFASYVDEQCALLTDEDRVGNRISAFGPVLIEYVRRCRGEDMPPRINNPYTDAQWEALTAVVERALASDCLPGDEVEPPPVTT